MEKIIFEEAQRFRASWFWIMIVLLTALPIISVCLWFLFQPEVKIPVVAWILVPIFSLVILLIFSIKLETTISDSKITYKFAPFHRKFRTIAREDILRVYVRNYSPILEYGGYGLRYRVTEGWAMIIHGNHGIHIELKNRKKILIGTQRAEEAEKALKIL